jgi:hypothetical protein
VLVRGECLEGFDFNQSELKPFHLPQIRGLAQCIVESQRTCKPISGVRLIGHTDTVGSAAFNLGLGQRRAARVLRELIRVLNELQPGLADRIRRNDGFQVETRGEAEPTDLNDRTKDRRVEVFLRNSIITSGCTPHTTRVRLHVKVFQDPCIPIPIMVENMKCLYGLAGFLAELVSVERLRNLPNLDGNDAIDIGDCRQGQVTPEQALLFANRNNVQPREIVAYFVRATSPLAVNGCAAHPPDKPSVIITALASEWTLAHEVGHVLGLVHPDEAPATARLRQRLMTGGGTDNILNVPQLVACEIKTMNQSPFTFRC